MEGHLYKKRFMKYSILSVLGTLGVSCYILADTFFVSKSLGMKGLTAWIDDWHGRWHKIFHLQISGRPQSNRRNFYQKGENTRDFSRGMNRPHLFAICNPTYCKNRYY